MTTGMVASAVALTESGILVNGMCVTDLLSGFEVRGEPEVVQPGTDTGPVYRGSGVPLHRLEAVRELVEEVLEARAADPELTSANPVVPRTVFPWGIGATVSDVLVTGPDKDAVASYLRVTGLRARVVDVAAALQVAGDLAAARSELTELSEISEHSELPEPPERDEDVRQETVEDADGADDAATRERRPARSLLLPVAVVAVLVLVVAGVGVALRPGDGTEPVAEAEPAGEVSDAVAEETPEPDDDGVDADGGETWRPMHQDGGDGGSTPSDEAVGDRPVVAVEVDVAGWQVTETTAERAIWTSDTDEKMRVLVAAVPTPVGTQAELDAVMLKALDGMDGADGAGGGSVAVTSRAPVAYEESFAESTTAWQVRLVDGHQVSVGCQYREFSPERTETCDRFAATARVR